MGGKFSIFGGSVDATFTALEAPSRIALDWRFRNWPDGAVSKVGQYSSGQQETANKDCDHWPDTLRIIGWSVSCQRQRQ